MGGMAFLQNQKHGGKGPRTPPKETARQTTLRPLKKDSQGEDPKHLVIGRHFVGVLCGEEGKLIVKARVWLVGEQSQEGTLVGEMAGGR